MNILLSIDKNYILPARVLMHSVESRASLPISWHILHCGDVESAALGGYNITMHDVRGLNLERFAGLGNHSYITPISFAWLFAPQILPDIDKVIKLDVDMVCLANITELANIEVAYTAGVRDVHHALHQHRLGIGTYVNVGTLSLNLAAMRADDFIGTVEVALSALSNIITLGDQDIFNVSNNGQLRELPFCWNWHYPKTTSPSRFKFRNIDERMEWAEARHRPSIVHYAGSGKPWASPEVRHAELWRQEFEHLISKELSK